MTVTTCVVVVEEQLAAVAVAVYVAVLFVLVACVKVCAIELPVPSASPLISAAAATVQLKVVPLTLLGLLMVTDVIAAPEHVLCDPELTETVGIGFTVTTCVVEDEQPVAVAVAV